MRAENKTLFAVVMARTNERQRSISEPMHWASLLRSGAASLIRSDMLTAFEKNDVSYDLPTEPPQDEKQLTIQVSRSFFARFCEEHDVHQLAQESFRRAVSRLFKYAECPPSHGYRGNESRMLDYLENCLSAAYLGRLYLEKTNLIRRKMADIAGEKIRTMRVTGQPKTAFDTPLDVSPHQTRG